MRLWSLQSTFSTSMLCKEKAIFISCHVLPSPATWACTHAINNAAHVSVQEAEASHVLIMCLSVLQLSFSTSMLCKEKAIFISCHVLPSLASWACTHAINNAAHVLVQEAEASHVLIIAFQITAASLPATAAPALPLANLQTLAVLFRLHRELHRALSLLPRRT